MRTGLVLLLLLPAIQAFAQSEQPDSTKILKPVVIQAYATERPLNEIPAAIHYLDTTTLNRFNNTSLLPAVNSMPGVRMEERSPGSYRFSIRGSLLRSPFGVRNVKFYWNGLPLTDGGGNTYLNLLDLSSIGSMEIIKGPGGSLYGAGTGGVVLLNSPFIKQAQWEASALAGSYGLRRFQMGQQFHHRKFNLRVQYSNQQYAGYRDQSAMQRHTVNADLVVQLNSRNALSATFFYADLFYETPGGLTKAQYDENARQARPGSQDLKAAVHNRTPYGGINYDHEWNDRWSTRVGILLSRSDFDNPTLRNYEERKERNVGGRTETSYRFGKEKGKGKITFGGEYQHLHSPIHVYGNATGEKDTVQTQDRLTSDLILFFAQADFGLPKNFYVTVGASYNGSSYTFSRAYPSLIRESRSLNPSVSPRLAILNKILPDISAFVSVSRGFSPPGIAELYPSRGIFDKQIQAEQGTNYEAGLKGDRLTGSISFDLSVYYFRLDKTLVIRRDETLPGDPEYFVNAGRTSQKGIEAMIEWNPVRQAKGFFTFFKIWNSYTLNRYIFDSYVFKDGSDYSGNKLTGVPSLVNVSGLDLIVKKKIYLNATASYVDHTPLNDDNSVFASEYFLLGTRAGYKTSIGRHVLDVFAGGDNLLDTTYSLGNDLNAVGGRYYNAAPGINFYAGLKFILAE